MSIPVLIQTYDEVRRLAIAGSVVAPGDFRLKKLVAPLEQAGQKAPVFAKVAEAVTHLAESNEQTSASALLRLASLVNSILYTQGETGLEGEISPLPTVELERPRTQASARVLKPLQEALTTTGSGRYEIIKDGIERKAFHDLRLISPSLAALDDSYSEIAELVADKILPLYGRAILPELEASFDPRGKGGQVRRLLLMHRLDPEAARPHVRRSLEEGSADVRVAAITCLGDSPEDLPFLLEQASSKAKGVRTAALEALGRSGADEAAQLLCKTIHRADFGIAIEPLRESRHPAVTSALLDEAEAKIAEMLATKEKDAKILGKQNERVILLLECLKGREDTRTETLLRNMFGQVDRIAAIKGNPDGNDVIERLVSVMASGPPSVRSLLIDSHATLPPESLRKAFVAARRSRDPAKVFEIFSPYLLAAVEEKKKRDVASMKRELVATQLIRWRMYDDDDDEVETSALPALDPRWLDLSVKLGRSDLVQALAVPGHPGAIAFLTKHFRQEFDRPNRDHETTHIIRTMIRVGHPAATDCLIELLQKMARAKSGVGYYGGFYWVSCLIPELPRAEAIPKLEALLPTLPERMIDSLLDYVTELKQGTPGETST